MSDEFRLLKCELNDDELRLKGEALAEAELAHKRLLAEKKAAVEAFKEPLAEQVGLIAKLAKEISEQAEVRDVEVDWKSDFETGVVDCVRKDTGEVVESRPMEDSDRQGTLGLEGVN